MDKTAIRITGLTKIYKGELGEKDQLGLDNLNLEISSGEVFAFIGPNGAGKTTAIKLLLRLMFPTEGSVDIFGLSNKFREAMNRGLHLHSAICHRQQRCRALMGKASWQESPALLKTR